MGITVPGTTVLIYDDADGTNHAGAPGTHTDAEISALAAAQFADLGTAPKNYHQQLTVQLGNSPGTALTTLTITDDVITILAGKQFTALAGSNTYLYAGTKVASGNVASGKRGPKIRGGSSISLPCNLGIYGSIIECETGGVLLANNASVTFCEIMNTLIRAATVIQLGSSGSAVPVLYNVNFMADNTNATCVTNFFTKRAERLTFTITGSIGFMLWNISVVPEVRDAAFFGTNTADIRMTSSPATPMKLVRHRWSGSAPRFPNSTFLTTDPNGVAAQEYGVCNFTMEDASTGVRQAGIEARLVDGLGIEIFPWTASDSNGEISFGDSVNTIYGNAVRALDYYRDAAATLKYAWRDRGNFILQVRDPLGYYADQTKVQSWPQADSQYGPVLRDWNQVVYLAPPAAPSIVTPILYQDVADPEPGEIVFESELPEVP